MKQPSSGEHQQPPIIAVLGVGAIGGVVAATLALKHAHQEARVVACVRHPITQLTLEIIDAGIENAPIEAWKSPDEVTKADWVILATKAQQVPDVGEWLTQLCDEHTRVAVLQNGIDHAKRLSTWGSEEQILPVIVYFNGERLERTHLRLTQAGDSDLLIPATPLGEDFAELMKGTPIRVKATDNFHTLAWRKLLMNAIANPITALTQRRLEVFQQADIQQLALAILKEAIVIARADGADIELTEAPSIVETLLAYPSSAGTSMYFDRQSGTPLEADAITGAIVEAAMRLDIPCPMNATLLPLLKAAS